MLTSSGAAGLAVKGSAFELRLMSDKSQLLGRTKVLFVATDANAPRRRSAISKRALDSFGELKFSPSQPTLSYRVGTGTKRSSLAVREKQPWLLAMRSELSATSYEL